MQRVLVLVAVAAAGVLAALAACDTGKAENKFAPPPLAVSPGMPAFKTVEDTVSTDKERVKVRLALSQPAEREQIDALMKDAYRQVMTRIGLEPSVVEIYVYANEERAKSAPDAWSGSCVKHQSDKGPTFENKVPLTFPKAVTAALGKDTFVGKLQPKVEIDEAKHHVTLTIPYVEPGKDAWADPFSYNTAMAVFVDYTRRLYENVPDMDGLTFIGVWKEQPVVRINLAVKDDYNTLDLYALGERIGGKQGKAFAEAQLTKKTDAQITKEKRQAERKEYEAALKKLPKGAVQIASSLK
ncbi:MAG TPA: hypothetical protein VKN99_27970 [Polyangia bacterium]|nr:hypothetical protein [Polyangia bacterium]